mmetsp:Transcript_4157/g.5521  ORF Transcript_4157/g.5521 Transcript_4157/m.5521 type:complete len:217 (-) Transcript_4157:590-1240(-)
MLTPIVSAFFAVLLRAGDIEAYNRRTCRDSLGDVSLSNRADPAVQNLHLVVLSDDLVSLRKQCLQATSLISFNNQRVVLLTLIILPEQSLQLRLLSLDLQLAFFVHVLQLPLLLLNVMHHVDKVLFLASFAPLCELATLALPAYICLALQFFHQVCLAVHGSLSDAEFRVVSLKIFLFQQAESLVQQCFVARFNCLFLDPGQLPDSLLDVIYLKLS